MAAGVASKPQHYEDLYLQSIRAYIVLLWAAVDLLWIRCVSWKIVALFAAVTLILHGYLICSQILKARATLRKLQSYTKEGYRSWWRMPAIHETMMIFASMLWVSSNMVWAMGEVISVDESATFDDVYYETTATALIIIYPAIALMGMYWIVNLIAFLKAREQSKSLEDPLLATSSPTKLTLVGCELTTVTFDKFVLWEDCFLTLWILKDTVWMLEWKVSWSIFVILTIFVFVRHLAKTPITWLLGMWILANVVWAGGELFWDDDVPGIPSGDLQKDIKFLIPPFLSWTDPWKMGACWWCRWLSGWILLLSIPMLGAASVVPLLRQHLKHDSE